MLTGNIIAGQESKAGSDYLLSTNPATQSQMTERFFVATAAEINQAVNAAYEAWKVYKKAPGSLKAQFLRTIAEEIENLGDTLVERVMLESGLPEGRVKGERGRTCNQLRLFADLVEEGSWVEAIIDEAMPDRQPMPRVDLRKMRQAIGPVAVFTASNFPQAFSTAGGDTASALAAGCPVIIKAHPSHLGTNALVAQAISKAAARCHLPKGVFSSLNGGIEVGQQLVQHPRVRAVGFTGSYKGGKALFDLANARPEPIPVYAEMGSNNPIFILEQKLKNDTKGLAENIANSVNLGAGQFCTNPGILVLEDSVATQQFLGALKSAFEQLVPATMLNQGIYAAFEQGKNACANAEGVQMLFAKANLDGKWEGLPAFASVSASDFFKNEALQEEVFGPFTLVVVCENKKEMQAVAEALQGQLTATMMGTNEEIIENAALAETLSEKCGRLIFNGVPTGVEVCHAMHHGGPFPATSNGLYTSVGTDAIKRFARPVNYQNAPSELLPNELKPDNPLGIWRKVNGKMTQA